MWAHSVWSQNTTTGGLRPQMFAPRSSGDGSEQGATDGVPAEGHLWLLSGSSGGLGSEARANSLLSLLRRALIPSRGTHPHDPSSPARLPGGATSANTTLGGRASTNGFGGYTVQSTAHQLWGISAKTQGGRAPGWKLFSRFLGLWGNRRCTGVGCKRYLELIWSRGWQRGSAPWEGWAFQSPPGRQGRRGCLHLEEEGPPRQEAICFTEHLSQPFTWAALGEAGFGPTAWGLLKARSRRKVKAPGPGGLWPWNQPCPA